MSGNFVEELLACLGVSGGEAGDVTGTNDKPPTPGPTDDTPTHAGTGDVPVTGDPGAPQKVATDDKPPTPGPTDDAPTQAGTGDAPATGDPGAPKKVATDDKPPTPGPTDDAPTQAGTGDAPVTGDPGAPKTAETGGTDGAPTDPSPPPPPPPPPPPMEGLMQIDPLYGDADFSEFFTIRRASYDLAFEAPRGMRLACDGAAAKVQMAAVARIKDAVEQAVADMRAGLGTETAPGKMSYSEAEKDILDPLNKRIQIEIDAILDHAIAAFKAITPDKVETDAVARFSKFKFLGSLRFPGGDAPTASREKIKPLLGDLQTMLVETKGINTVGTTLTNTAADFARAWQETQKSQDETPEPELETQAETSTGNTRDGAKGKPAPRTAPQQTETRKLKMLGESDVAMLRPKAEAVAARLKDFDAALDKVEKLHAQIEKIAKQIERINKKEGGAAQVEEDRKAYGAVEKSLGKFKDDAGRLAQLLTEAIDGARTVRILMETPFIADTPTRVDTAAKAIKGFEIVQQGRDLYHRAKELAAAVKEA